MTLDFINVHFLRGEAFRRSAIDLKGQTTLPEKMAVVMFTFWQLVNILKQFSKNWILKYFMNSIMKGLLVKMVRIFSKTCKNIRVLFMCLSCWLIGFLKGIYQLGILTWFLQFLYRVFQLSHIKCKKITKLISLLTSVTENPENPVEGSYINNVDSWGGRGLAK